MVVKKRGDWLIARVGGEFVMMSRQKVHHIGVTEVSARIWELADQTQDVAAICDVLRKEYDVPADVCRAEVDAFLNDLAEQGAVTLDGQRGM
jgi:Coenzyme PQQ synthesis protein D (PqqD)